MFSSARDEPHIHYWLSVCFSSGVPIWKPLAKPGVQRVGMYGVFRKGVRSGLLHFISLSGELPPTSTLASNPLGEKGPLQVPGPRSQKLTMPSAGGRKSLLTPAKRGSGAFLLPEKRTLEIGTELFVVKAAWIPSMSKALGKNLAAPGRHCHL